MFIPKKINKSQILNEKKKKKKEREIRSDQDHDQIRSRFDPEIGAGMLGGPLRWLRCDGDGGFGASREIDERESEVARGGWGWLGTVRKRAESRE